MLSAYTPRMLFLEITSECNLRCKQCFMWKLKDGLGRLQEADYLRVIRDFRLINNKGAVILTGGEVFKNPNLVFTILKNCNKSGVETVINTNGTLIKESFYHDLLIHGPSKLVFSLDSHRKELHDFIRGIPGTFDHVISTIKDLINLRKKSGCTDKKIYISTILHNANINELEEFISFIKMLEIDGITFQVLTPSFFGPFKIEHDYFFNHFFFKDLPAAMMRINDLIKWSSSDSFILNTKWDLQKIIEYMLSPLHTKKNICSAHQNNLVIDHMGNLKYCYNMDAVFNRTIGNVQSNALQELLFNENSIDAREKMKYCKMSCGILNCNK